MAEEMNELKEKLLKIEEEKQSHILEIKRFEIELKESQRLRSNMDLLNDELKKAKENYYTERLQLDKAKITLSELQQAKDKLEKKY